MNEDGTMAKGQDLFNFAKKHNLILKYLFDGATFKTKLKPKIYLLI